MAIDRITLRETTADNPAFSEIRLFSMTLSACRTPLATFLSIALAAAVLLACTPAYDWRTIQNNDDGYEITLPSKPRNDARDIEIAGQKMHMSMQTAEAGDAVFAVGTVDLPNAEPATQRATLEFLQQGLAHNLNAAPAVQVVQIDIAAGGKLSGEELNVSGSTPPADDNAKPQPRQIHARFVAKGQHVYQIAVVATRSPPAEQIDQFFSSFKLY